MTSLGLPAVRNSMPVKPPAKSVCPTTDIAACSSSMCDEGDMELASHSISDHNGRSSNHVVPTVPLAAWPAIAQPLPILEPDGQTTRSIVTTGYDEPAYMPKRHRRHQESQFSGHLPASTYAKHVEQLSSRQTQISHLPQLPWAAFTTPVTGGDHVSSKPAHSADHDWHMSMQKQQQADISKHCHDASSSVPNFCTPLQFGAAEQSAQGSPVKLQCTTQPPSLPVPCESRAAALSPEEATSSTESAVERIDIRSLCPSSSRDQKSTSSTNDQTSCKHHTDSVTLPPPPAVPRPGSGSKLSRVPRSTAKGWTAFTSFGLHARESARALNPDAVPAEIEKLVGIMWSRLSADDKQHWVNHARSGRGSSQSGKLSRKQSAKRAGSPISIPNDDADYDDAHMSQASSRVQHFTHHHQRSLRRHSNYDGQLTDDNSPLPFTWQRKAARAYPTPHCNLTTVDNLHLEVNTIETLAEMQAAASHGSRSWS